MNKSLFIPTALSLFCALGHAEQRFQAHESIYLIVKNTIAAKISPAADYGINIVPLDSQLQLPECTQPLEAFAVAEHIKAGRVSMGVRCSAGQKWSLYVSALISVYENILVLAQPLQRGEIITPAMLVSERREVSRLREDYFTQAQQVENKQAARPLAAGSILSLRNISEPLAVKKGDKVLIRSTHTGLSITMGGLAMMDGVKGQRIRVKNENSGRIINATVIETGLVTVQ
ncbi:MAG: flagellar basal body P-ring formation chaperone FlgA [Methylovulum sp.]|nr:flagellar basal body P-ring formation chaperone FlgA [Methylovulum sp.]